MRMNIEQVPKPCDVDADPVQTWGRLILIQEASEESTEQVHRGSDDSMRA